MHFESPIQVKYFNECPSGLELWVEHAKMTGTGNHSIAAYAQGQQGGTVRYAPIHLL